MACVIAEDDDSLLRSEDYKEVAALLCSGESSTEKLQLLDDFVLEHIFSFLPLRFLVGAQLVCHKWRSVIRGSAAIWQNQLITLLHSHPDFDCRNLLKLLDSWKGKEARVEYDLEDFGDSETEIADSVNVADAAVGVNESANAAKHLTLFSTAEKQEDSRKGNADPAAKELIRDPVDFDLQRRNSIDREDPTSNKKRAAAKAGVRPILEVAANAEISFDLGEAKAETDAELGSHSELEEEEEEATPEEKLKSDMPSEGAEQGVQHAETGLNAEADCAIEEGIRADVAAYAAVMAAPQPAAVADAAAIPEEDAREVGAVGGEGAVVEPDEEIDNDDAASEASSVRSRDPFSTTRDTDNGRYFFAHLLIEYRQCGRQ